jgi:hypothetical protein
MRPQNHRIAAVFSQLPTTDCNAIAHPIDAAIAENEPHGTRAIIRRGGDWRQSSDAGSIIGVTAAGEAAELVGVEKFCGHGTNLKYLAPY